MREDGTRKEVEQLIEDITVQKLWVHAADGWQSKGLQSGLDAEATLAWHGKLQKNGKHSEAGVLETLLCGGWWSPSRIKQMRRGPSTPCLLCGQLDTGDLHTYWTCLFHGESEDEDIKDTQYLVQAATEGSVEFLYLWLRGCLPVCMVEVRTPVSEIESFEYLGAVGARFWPGGKLWTDASEGEYGNVRRIRRCGCGIAGVQLYNGGAQ